MTVKSQSHINNNEKSTEDSSKKLDREEFLKQFPRNLVSNVFLFIVNMASGIWLVPFLIDHLGVATYGLIPLANSLTHYVALVTIAISSGIARFLTIDLQKKDYERANRTFNTSFWSLLIVIISSIPFIIAFIHFVPIFFNIPAAQIHASKWLFGGIFSAFLLITLSSCFGASAFALNRLDLRNLVQIVRTLSRLVFIILLFRFIAISLENVAFATLLSAFFHIILLFVMWQNLTPDLRINFLYFDKSCLKDITHLGGWHLINHVATLLILQIDLIVVNRLFGPTAGGEYASVLQWSILIRTMAGVLAAVFQPMFLISYAKNNIDDLVKLSKMSIKFMTLALALPVGLACGFSKELLSIWISPEFSKLSLLMIIMLFHLVTNLAEMPLYSIYLCYNRLSISGIITFVIGGLNLILAILIPVIFNTGFYGVAIAGAISLTLKCSFFAPWYAANVIGIRRRSYFLEMVKGPIAFVVVFSLSMLFKTIWVVNTWTMIFVGGSFVGLSYLALVWFLGLSTTERNIINKMLKRK